MDQFMHLGNAELWALAVAFFSPPFISILQQTKWGERTQSLVAFGFYLVVALVTAYFAGLVNPTDIARLTLLIFLMAATSYKALWKPTGVSPAIEAKTNLPDNEPRHSA